MKRVEIISKKRMFDDFFKVDEAILRYERLDGGMSEPVRRLSLERGDGVAVLVYRPRQRSVMLVRQFRFAAHAQGEGWLLEVVAGMLEKGEAPEETARREIAEEMGCQVGELRPISTFYLSPGGSSERIFLYFAEVDEEAPPGAGGGGEEEHEDIEVVELGLEEVWRSLDRGEIDDAKTLVALMWLRRHLEKRKT